MNGTMYDQRSPYLVIGNYLHKLAGELLKLKESLKEFYHKTA